MQKKKKKGNESFKTGSVMLFVFKFKYQLSTQIKIQGDWLTDTFSGGKLVFCILLGRRDVGAGSA